MSGIVFGQRQNTIKYDRLKCKKYSLCACMCYCLTFFFILHVGMRMFTIDDYNDMPTEHVISLEYLTYVIVLHCVLAAFCQLLLNEYCIVLTITVSNPVASEAICKWGHNAEKFLMCPLTFLLCPPHEGHNDCLLPTERQLKWWSRERGNKSNGALYILIYSYSQHF